MEVNKVSVICLVLACAAFTSVQSASYYYRAGREIEIPVENEIIREEIVSELKREPEIAIIETEPIAAIIKEEVVIPVEQLRVAAPAIEVQEPVAVISEKEQTNAVVEEVAALRSAPETVIPVVVEEKIVSEPIAEGPAAVVAVEEPLPKSRNEPLISVQTEVKEAPVEEVPAAEKSNPIEEVVVVEKENVVVDEVPAVKIDESLRQSENASASPTTARPSVFQAISSQFQNQIQTLQSQIQNVFNQNAQNADSTATTTARPGFIAQFQQIFNRPAGSPGPFQGVASAIQQNIQQNIEAVQGFLRPQAAAATAASPATVPVVVAPVYPISEKTMLGEVPVVNEPAAVVEKVEEKEVVKKSD